MAQTAPKLRTFKQIHTSVHQAMKTKKGWAEFDESAARLEQAQWLEQVASRNCVDVLNPSRGETNCDCMQVAIDDMNFEETMQFGRAMSGLLKKTRKDIDRHVVEWVKYAEASRRDLAGRDKATQQRVYLLPGAHKHKVCKNAIAALFGYGRDSWKTLVQAAKEGEFRDHGLTGKCSNNLKKFNHAPLLHEFFTKTQLHAAPRATKIVRCEVCGADGSVRVETELRDVDEELFELPPNFSKLGLYKRMCREECGLMLKFDNKNRMIGKEPIEGKEQRPVPCWGTFCNFWERNYPKMIIQKPRQDVCGDCFKYANRFKTLSGTKRKDPEDSDGEEEYDKENDTSINVPDDEEERMLESEREVELAAMHVRMAKDQRELFNRQKTLARNTVALPKSERIVTFMCDYAQNLYVQNFGSEQPGETYYYSPLNAYVFGMVDCSNDLLHAHLYMEGEAKKGGNNVASMLIWQLQHQKLLAPFRDEEHLPNDWEPLKELNLWFDNCGGQNKNRMVIRLLPILLQRRVAQKISFNFLVAGHTKNDCDRLFNLLKKTYRESNCYIPDQLDNILNIERQVELHRMETTIFFDYAKAQDEVMKSVDSVNSYHCFSGTLEDPTKILLRPHYTCSNDQRSSQMVVKKSFKDD